MDKNIAKVLNIFKKNNPMAQFLNEQSASRVDGWLDTGSLSLNAIVSGKMVGGGIPLGRLTCLGGESMTGKSFFSTNLIKNALKMGLAPVVIDSENAYEPSAVAKSGINPEEIMHVPVFTLEECKNQLYQFGKAIIENGQQGKFFVVIDSVSQLSSEMALNRMEKGSTSMDMGTKARAVKELVTECLRISALTKTTFVLVTHIYDNPGEMFPSLEKSVPGGKSLRYLPSVVLQLARRPVKEGDDKVKEAQKGTLTAGQKSYPGVVLRALTVKNRFIKQYLEAESYLSFEKGLHPYFGLINLALEFGVIEKDGRSYVISKTKENLGMYATWHDNKEKWDKIIPLLQEELDAHWPYGSTNGVADKEEQELLNSDEA